MFGVESVKYPHYSQIREIFLQDGWHKVSDFRITSDGEFFDCAEVDYLTRLVGTMDSMILIRYEPT